MKKKVFIVKKQNTPHETVEDKNKLFQFPHISRFFTASGLKRVFKDIFIMFLVFSVLSVLIVNFLYPTSSFENAKLKLFINPYSAKSYISLADLYLESNDFQSAKRELNNAVFFSNNQTDSVEATRKLLLIERSERTRVEIDSEISKWEKIAKEKSNYRDAFFRLAVLNYQIYKNDEAKVYLEKAMALDPNFDEGKRLRELL